MSFYNLLQLNPGELKNHIHNASNHQERFKLYLAIITRAILIVLFAIVLIAPLSQIFGSENSAMLVSLFCIILSIRFVDFGYNLKASITSLGLSFFLLCFGPLIATKFNPLIGAIINFISLLLILIMTCKNPIMGNGGLYGFAYVFLAGNPVSGDLALKRALLTLISFIVCALIYYQKHKDKNPEITFKSELNCFSLTNRKSQYQLRLALGISLLLFIGDILNIERFMWAGFACSSLLSTYESHEIKARSSHRILSTLIGTALFFIVYSLAPTSLHALFGPVCGLCLGFCVEYRHKTTINCFSALLLATSLYGLSTALALRIVHNIAGVIFAMIFVFIFEKFIEKYVAINA